MGKEVVKLEISTHGGDVDIVEVDDYNANDLEKTLNDNDIHAIAIGDNVYSRIDIKNVKPYTKDEG